MTYWILPKSAIPISCDSVQRCTTDELRTDEMIQRCDEYTQSVNKRLEAAAGDIQLPDVLQELVFDIENEEQRFLDEFNRVIGDPNLPHADEVPVGNDKVPDEPTDPDNYLGMIVGRRRDPERPLEQAHVKRRALDDQGVPIGKAHSNPLMDSRVYELEYEDGTTEALTANILAENILAQVDENGYRQLMIDEIVDHRKDKQAIPFDKGTFTTKNGTRRKVFTTRGWQIYVRWKDGSHDWVELKDMKDSYPVELDTYAEDRELLEEPAFAWWTTNVFRRKRRMMKAVKSKYWEKTSKYGIPIPKTVKEAIGIHYGRMQYVTK